VLKRSDIAYSTRFATPPEYPCLASHFDLSSEFFPRDQRQFPLDDQSLQLRHTLRQISYLVSLPNITPYQKHAATSIVTNTEYLILSTATIPNPETSPQAVLSQAFMLASLLYLHLAFRLIPSFPNPSKLHLRLVSKILSLVSSLSPSDFSSTEALDLLLWFMFICSAASSSAYPRHSQVESESGLERGIGFQVQDTVALVWKMHPQVVVQSKSQVRARLRSVVWRDGVCDVLHDGIWKVVESMRSGNTMRT
jgi:Fungal specific transcription factor domain